MFFNLCQILIYEQDNNKFVDKAVKESISKGNMSSLNCPEEVLLSEKFLSVKKTNEVKNGDIVIARIDDEVTIKYFNRKGRIYSGPFFYLLCFFLISSILISS